MRAAEWMWWSFGRRWRWKTSLNAERVSQGESEECGMGLSRKGEEVRGRRDLGEGSWRGTFLERDSIGELHSLEVGVGRSVLRIHISVFYRAKTLI